MVVLQKRLPGVSARALERFAAEAGRAAGIRGEVDMAQNYALEDWELEQGYVLACQSRVKSTVLELDYDEK